MDSVETLYVAKQAGLSASLCFVLLHGLNPFSQYRNLQHLLFCLCDGDNCHVTPGVTLVVSNRRLSILDSPSMERIGGRNDCTKPLVFSWVLGSLRDTRDVARGTKALSFYFSVHGVGGSAFPFYPLALLIDMV